jgi:hypothetical protein
MPTNKMDVQHEDVQAVSMQANIDASSRGMKHKMMLLYCPYILIAQLGVDKHQSRLCER